MSQKAKLRGKQAVGYARRLVVERLEDRQLLATIPITTLNGPGGVATAAIQDDADNTGLHVLMVTGTNRNDFIAIEPQVMGSPQIRIRINGQTVGSFPTTAFERIVAYGLNGDDTIVVNGALSQSATLLGGTGSDNIFGGSGDDRISGESGSDRLYGGNGNDTLEGGDGNDFMDGQGGNDTLFGEAGNDRLYGSAGDDLLIGGEANDILYGGNGNDQLFGQAGNDDLLGENDNDIVVGGDGIDRLWGGVGRDLLIGGTRADQVYGEAGDDILIAGTTTYDDDSVALQAIFAEWTSTTDSYDDRITSIRNGGVTNGTYVLDDDTVVESLTDLLVGNAGQDWFWTGAKKLIKDLAKTEVFN
jgi:Ca2+-binding RTX toxin-like protein